MQKTICYHSHLHPTMYLLIQQPDRKKICKYQNLHPTMYLLILSHFIDNLMIKKFTSHYVSINSIFPVLNPVMTL